uniref:Chromo domain-containing protein n=1 Tax=Meloidogyne incognita TaxID=6306 RepID=A0A914LHP8_MELIC
MANHNVKEENISFSDHDYVPPLDEINLDNVFIDVENVESNENVTSRRTIKKPQIFTMDKQEKQAKKRKAPKSGNVGRKNIKKEVPQYEVDYIFGKRSDKLHKGKIEYRVFWKGYAISDASWEPEDNLRHCSDAIENYERSQGFVQTKASKQKEAKLENLEDSKPTTSASKQVSSNGKNGKKNGRKKGKKRASSVGVDKKPVTKKQKLEEFSGTRARSTSFTKRKGSNSSNDGKTTIATNNSFNSKDTTPLRSDSLEGQNDNKAGVVTRKHTKENNENGRVLTKNHSQLNVANISLITSVHPSGIDGIMDLVADVVMKDGSIRSVLTETLKNEAPRILFDYYERAMELKD